MHSVYTSRIRTGNIPHREDFAMKRHTIMLALAMWALPALPLSAAESAPNIVLIVSDDHGWTDYGFMGHPHIQTPHLDKLASQSLVFRRGYVPSSLCCPSLASMITGLNPHQHKISGNDPPMGGKKRTDAEGQKAFRDGREVMCRHLEAVPTLPKLLGQKGYLSLQTGKWWQGDYKRGGFTHGMTRGDRHGDDGLKIGRQSMQPITDFIVEARRDNKPFFVWYAPMLPHQPHNPPQRLFDKYKDKAPTEHVARYWAMVEWFDETCGELLSILDKANVADNTMVLYVTDNGWLQTPDKPGRMRSKLTPYDAALRPPIMIRWPGKVKPRTSDELAMSIDLVPTVLAALGMKPTADMQGVNLLDDNALKGRKTIFGECFAHDIADLNDPAKGLLHRWVIDGRWKLIDPNAEGSKAELYDVIADPHEKIDHAAKNPEVVESLRRKLDGWWKPAR